VAWINVALHVLGLALAAWGMRPGTPLMPLSERLAYLRDDAWGWSLGWGVWMCCVPVLVAFFALVAKRLGPTSDLARLALFVVAVAGGIDLSCDVIFVVALPWLAAQPLAELQFLTLERATGAVSLIVANGLYTAASLLLNGALHGRPGFGVGTIGIGYGIGLFGFLLAAAGFTGVPWHVEWATGPTIGFFCLWTLLVARALGSTKEPTCPQS
jgi:hypothetical protein